MKSIVCCLVVLAVAAHAQILPYPGFVPPPVISTKYHAQDELGQARFGYAYPGQAATNYRDALGNHIGSYAYINPDGKEVRVAFTADHRGFRVLSNDLPVAPVANLVAPPPVVDTPEVAQARAIHMAALAEAIRNAQSIAPAPPAPLPIVKTPIAPVPSGPAPIVKTPTAPVSTGPAPVVKTPTAPVSTGPAPVVKTPTAPVSTGPAPVVKTPTTPVSTGPAPVVKTPTTPVSTGPAPVVKTPTAPVSTGPAPDVKTQTATKPVAPGTVPDPKTNVSVPDMDTPESAIKNVKPGDVAISYPSPASTYNFGNPYFNNNANPATYNFPY